VFHKLGSDDIPTNYISFYYDDDGKYVEVDAADLEFNDDDEDYDDYPVWDTTVLEEEVQRRVVVLLAGWIMSKEAAGEWPSAEQQAEQTDIFTADLRHTLRINIFRNTARRVSGAKLGYFHHAIKVKGICKSKGKGKTRTSSQFRPLLKGKGMIHQPMGKGAGKVKARSGKGYDETHQDCTRFLSDIEGCESIHGGATFRDRSLRDPSGTFFPTDKADPLQLNSDHHNEYSAQGDILEHSRGSLDVLPLPHVWKPLAHWDRLASWVNFLPEDEMPSGIALFRAAERWPSVLQKLTTQKERNFEPSSLSVETEWSIDQEKALLAIAEGVQQDDADTPDFLTRCFHLSGRPGFGKSEVIIHAALGASQKGGQVLILCPTGTLVHVYRDRLGDMNGVTVDTIHSAFQFCRNADIAVNYGLPSSLRRYDLIMLDEASQVHDEVCARVFVAIRELPRRPFFVISSDFQQLNPIGASTLVMEFCKTVDTVDLVTVHRSIDDALAATTSKSTRRQQLSDRE
jgi:hypothetical protein